MMFQADEAYKLFNSRLVQTNYPLLGVRVPEIRKVEKNAIKNGVWKEIIQKEAIYHEDIQLKAFIIGAAPMSVTERQKELEKFFPFMDNWQVVDGLVSSLKETKKEKEAYWYWLVSLRNSNHSFIIRFIVVMYLTYYLDNEYLFECLHYFESITMDDYYVKMAIAWAISIAYIKHPKEVEEFLQKTNLEKWTYNKALQKIIESNRIPTATKVYIKSLKR